ncbi:antitoxin VbhA family protein [Pectobacterium aroidearum]|uniref:antitoxin VbhA family protein n=1 Tax=Pectobacterium aroidearum TaxID=1201031 RepID=UPI0015DE4324|nr:antitoxin VbhA family protein [Pectobacterium aroidearum]MBA0205823.1 antitoxin VbhA family protein [Pectobacterium aroidearum]
MTDDRTLQLRLIGFRKAEASLRLEGMDPSGTSLYESVKARILSGELTFDEGRAEVRAHYQKRENSN